jgi:hypothetical protein
MGDNGKFVSTFFSQLILFRQENSTKSPIKPQVAQAQHLWIWPSIYSLRLYWKTMLKLNENNFKSCTLLFELSRQFHFIVN